MGVVRLGTSSWSEKGWLGSFYPNGLPAEKFLGHYATRFPAVEADVTYYRVPSERMVLGWERRSPPGFRLCAKFPRSIVHAGRGSKPDGEKVLHPQHAASDCRAFLAAMETLGERAGPLILQFPYFNKSAFAGLDRFLERLEPFLAQLPTDRAFGVEVRNRQWICEPLLEVLRQAGVTLVLADLPYMPHPDSLPSDMDLLTSDRIYVRLIGDRKLTNALTSTFDAPVVDRQQRLERWADWLVPMCARVRETYVFANNHFAGHGPATADALGKLLAARGVDPEGPASRPPGELF